MSPCCPHNRALQRVIEAVRPLRGLRPGQHEGAAAEAERVLPGGHGHGHPRRLGAQVKALII